MAKSQIFTTNIKTIATAIGTYYEDRDLHKLIELVLEMKPNRRLQLRRLFQQLHVLDFQLWVLKCTKWLKEPFKNCYMLEGLLRC